MDNSNELILYYLVVVCYFNTLSTLLSRADPSQAVPGNAFTIVDYYCQLQSALLALFSGQFQQLAGPVLKRRYQTQQSSLQLTTPVYNSVKYSV